MIVSFQYITVDPDQLQILQGLWFPWCSTAMIVSFQYITVDPDQLQILQGLWFPWCSNCSRDAIKQLVGIVGAVIMPHNIYLHSALVLVSVCVVFVCWSV